MMPTLTAVQKSIVRTAIAAAIIFLFAGRTTRAQDAPQDDPPKPNVRPGQLPPQSPAPIAPPATGTPQIPSQTQTPEPQTGASKPAGQSDTRNRIRVRSDLVIVPVTVKNRDGALIGDLQRDEFRIFCDNVEQQIIFFTSDPFPLSAVVLIDNDLSIKSAEQVQKSLTAISAGFGPRTKWRW